MTDPRSWTGAGVFGVDGQLLGHVGSIYTDNATGRPVWVSVVGATHTAVVPLEGVRFDGQGAHVPFDAAQLRTAPHPDPATLITYQDGDDLARHYGLIPPGPPTTPADADDLSTDDLSTDDLHRGERSAEMVRSEEQLRAGAVNVTVGRARLITYIVTEDQTFTIPVSRQEVRLVFDPFPASEQIATDTPLTEETYEVVRHTEQVLFTKQIVPVERVRMIKSVVTTAHTVTTPLRSEQFTLTHHDTSTADTDTTTSTGLASDGDHSRTGDPSWD